MNNKAKMKKGSSPSQAHMFRRGGLSTGAGRNSMDSARVVMGRIAGQKRQKRIKVDTEMKLSGAWAAKPTPPIVVRPCYGCA